MRLLMIVPAGILAACAANSIAPQPAAAPVRTANISAVLLDAHNRQRLAASVPPLVWDTTLAASASIYARQLAALGVLRHSPREARPGQGENLWMGTRGVFPLERMVADWASERANFRPGIFPAVSRTGNWADVGHYSQIIWPTTTRLGCALGTSARVDVLVCRYAPAGNVDGRRVP